MNWLYRILTAEITERKVAEQEKAIELLLWKIEQMKLDHIRSTRGLVEQFFLAQENGVDVTEPLLDGMRDLDDHIARLEEFQL